MTLLIEGLNALARELEQHRTELATTNARVGSILCALVAAGASDYSQRAEIMATKERSTRSPPA